jgi:hypothetical protein
MFMPLMGFLLTLTVVSGLATLVIAADPHIARFAPPVYAVSHACLAFFFSLAGVAGVGSFLEIMISDMFFGVAMCSFGVGGIILGHRNGLRRQQQAAVQLQLERQEQR